MLIVDRQKRLLDIIRQKQSASLDALADELAVSSSTVRRDIDTLQSQGLVETTRGGVIYRGRGASSLALDQRMAEQVQAKIAIGRAAAALVEPGMTVLFDGGSTIRYALEQIHVRPLQVVTNSLTVAAYFANDEQVELLVLGGALYPRSGVLVGPIAAKALADIHADLFLFSVAGVFGTDIFNSNLAMAEFERLAIRQTARRVLLVDATKFGRKSLARVCSVEDLDLVISDADLGAGWQNALSDRIKIAASTD